MSQVEYYRAVLDDLQNQRNVLQYRIKEIDTAITSLHRLIPEGANNEVRTPTMTNVPSAVVPQGKYAGMSVRWAVLNLLAEDATAPMTTGDIADALLRAAESLAGATSFTREYVSAVLSGMNHDRHEVSAGENGWVITERTAGGVHGRTSARSGALNNSNSRFPPQRAIAPLRAIAVSSLSGELGRSRFTTYIASLASTGHSFGVFPSIGIFERRTVHALSDGLFYDLTGDLHEVQSLA